MRYVLFDLGGVVVRTPFELVPALESRRALAAGALGLHGPFDPGRDELWQRRVSGEISERGYWQEQAARIDPGASVETADSTRWLMRELYDVAEDLIVRPEVVALLDGFDGRGLRVAALTNDLSRHHSAAWIERITTFTRFDPLIDLSDFGTFKPDPAAYRHALDVLGGPPDSLLFIDDQVENVSAAREAGIPTVLFDPTDVEASIEAIHASLGPPASLDPPGG